MATQVSKFWAGLFKAKVPADVPLTIQAAAGQTGKLLRFLDSSGNELQSVSADGAGALRYAEITISAASVLLLRATPYTLVAAPGAGKYLEFVSAVLILDYGTVAYTESAANLAVRFTGASGTIVSQAIEATGFADVTADTATNALPKIDAISAKTACENKGLFLHNTGAGEWANSGDSVLRVKVLYRVHNTGW